MSIANGLFKKSHFSSFCCFLKIFSVYTINTEFSVLQFLCFFLSFLFLITLAQTSTTMLTEWARKDIFKLFLIFIERCFATGIMVVRFLIHCISLKNFHDLPSFFKSSMNDYFPFQSDNIVNYIDRSLNN